MKYVLLLMVLIGFACGCRKIGNTVNDDIPKHKDTITEAQTSPHFHHHQPFADLNFTSEQQWDSLNGKSVRPRLVSPYKRHSDYKTFGWHLYSKGSAYKNYNFSLLWGVAYFSYSVDPETGSYKSIHQWKTTALIDSAKAHKSKVFLSVSNFGAKDNTTFLTNTRAQKTLTDSLTVLLTLREANGINIDFEGMSATNRTAFTDFIISTAKQLKQQNSDYEISIALYAVDYHRVFDIKAIDPYVDFYTLMAYDYYGGFSEYAGPVAPLHSSKTWGAHSVEASVAYYLNEGVRPEKLIVGVPYYGAEWKVKSSGIPEKAEAFYAHPTYSRIKNHYIDSLRVQVRYDAQSSNAYFSLETESGALKQIWFDDSLSLSKKYDWIKDKKLSGAAIWALGYDEDTEALWGLLGAKFGQND